MTGSEIRWVSTPDCTVCVPTGEMKRRPQCAGCSKQPPVPPAPVKAGAKHRLRACQQSKRDIEIATLSGTGLSLAQIGKLLGMPRATVNNALIRQKKKSGMDAPGSPGGPAR
ncbi:MAG: hypothetical protein P4M02_05535 [Clostridia bacterium]|nr:hypothetical protein [Clostridia bacterium]